MTSVVSCTCTASSNHNCYRCDLLQKLCDLIFSDDLDQMEAVNLAFCLCHLLSDELTPGTSLLPQDISAEYVLSLALKQMTEMVVFFFISSSCAKNLL